MSLLIQLDTAGMVVASTLLILLVLVAIVLPGSRNRISLDAPTIR